MDAKSMHHLGYGTMAAKVQQLAARAARDPDAPIANGWFIFYLALVVAVLIFVVGGVGEWHSGSGRGNAIVDGVWRVTWVTFQILKTTFISLLLIWAYRRFTNKSEEPDGDGR